MWWVLMSVREVDKGSTEDEGERARKRSVEVEAHGRATRRKLLIWGGQLAAKSQAAAFPIYSAPARSPSSPSPPAPHRIYNIALFVAPAAPIPVPTPSAPHPASQMAPKETKSSASAAKTASHPSYKGKSLCLAVAAVAITAPRCASVAARSRSLACILY